MTNPVRPRWTLELAGALELDGATYLVHVRMSRTGQPDQVRVTLACGRAAPQVMGCGAVLTWHLRRGGALDDDTLAPVVRPVAVAAGRVATGAASIITELAAIEGRRE